MSISPRSSMEIQEHRAARAPLLAVRGVSETVTAGCGNAWLLVRTLDDVSLDLCGGDLVLLSGRVGEGAASLAGALAGRRRIVHGNRDVHPGVRVRRGVVSSAAQHAIIDGWTAGRTSRRVSDQGNGPRTAYILRVRRPSPRARTAVIIRSSCDNHAGAAHSADYPSGAWFGWARALCECGGAIVLWDVVERHGRPATGSAVHEQSAQTVLPYGSGSGVEGPGYARGAAERAGRLRVMSLVAGRLVPAPQSAPAPRVTLPVPAQLQEGRP